MFVRLCVSGVPPYVSLILTSALLCVCVCVFVRLCVSVPSVCVCLLVFVCVCVCNVFVCGGVCVLVGVFVCVCCLCVSVVYVCQCVGVCQCAVSGQCELQHWMREDTQCVCVCVLLIECCGKGENNNVDAEWRRPGRMWFSKNVAASKGIGRGRPHVWSDVRTGVGLDGSGRQLW